MRPLIIKDRYIGKTKINAFKDFVLEDNYFIKEKDDGFKIEGTIKIKGNVIYDDEQEEINKDIKIDILIPYDKLESRNMIKLLLDKAEFDTNENILLIKIKIKVQGEEIKETLFPLDERKMEYPPIESVDEVINNNEIDDEFLKSMEEMIKNNNGNVEIISTLKDEIKENNDILEVRVDDEIKEESSDPLPIVNEEKFKENIIENKKEELLKTEYIPTFFFHRVKKEESLDAILLKYNMSIDEFDKLNKNKDIKENDLIQIKIR